MPLYQDASPRKYVLVVDSERVTRLTFESILTRAGYRVVTAANLRDALAAIEQTHFHAILADFDRGKGPALDLLAMKNISGGAVPIVVVDKNENSESASACLTLGACRFLSKPVHTEELVRLMEQILD